MNGISVVALTISKTDSLPTHPLNESTPHKFVLNLADLQTKEHEAQISYTLTYQTSSTGQPHLSSEVSPDTIPDFLHPNQHLHV